MKQSRGKTPRGKGQEIKGEIQNLIKKYHLNMCVECGKCSAVCPMVAFYGGDFVYKRSTRAVAERLCYDPVDGAYDEALWYCLACQECTFFCPSGVNFQDFMLDLRNLLISKGHTKYAHFCSECGAYMMPVHQYDVLQKKPETRVEVLYECPVCKKRKQAEALRRFSPKHGRFRAAPYGNRNHPPAAAVGRGR